MCNFSLPVIRLIPTRGSCAAAAARSIAVQPLVFDLLVYLIENRDRVVTRDDLLGRALGRPDGRGFHPRHATSTRRAARSATSGEEQKLIRTVARKGLRFVGEVQTASAGDKRPRRPPHHRREPPHCPIPAVPRSPCSPSTT